MSTSILYRAIGLGGYRHVATWEEKGEFKLRVQPPESAICCPGCGSNDVIHRGTYDRRVHAPPIGLRKTVVFIRAPRVECRRCQTVRIVQLPCVVPLSNHTKSFARLVVDLRKMMTIQDIALFLGASTTMIKSIDNAISKDITASRN